jgi:hypothetical protein
LHLLAPCHLLQQQQLLLVVVLQLHSLRMPHQVVGSLEVVVAVEVRRAGPAAAAAVVA